MQEKNAKKKEKTERQAEGWDEKYPAAEGQMFFSFSAANVLVILAGQKTNFKENTR
jgi:hypothetical protein